MIVYGRNPVRECLRGPRAVGAVWATEAAARARWLSRREVAIVSAAELERRCGSEAHQGVCAEVEPYRYRDAAELLDRQAGPILALDQVQDPQNLGAICRTAECAGVAGVVIPDRRSASVTPAVCKASAGAVEHLRIARVRNLADFLIRAKAAGAWVYGAQAGAAVSHTEVQFAATPVLVLGSEGRGLRPRVAAACDLLIGIPLYGRIASLGVSAAAAVLLYAMARARPGA